MMIMTFSCIFLGFHSGSEASRIWRSEEGCLWRGGLCLYYCFDLDGYYFNLDV